MSDENKRFGKVLITAMVAIVAFLWLAGFNNGIKISSNNNKFLDESTFFSDYVMEKYPDGTISATDFQEYDIIVYNAWAPWCTACVKEMPCLNELYKEYKDQGILVVGIVADYENEIGYYPDYDIDIANAVKAYDIDYPIALGDSRFLEEIGPTMDNCLPCTWIIDKNGNLVDYFIGSKSEDDWKELFAKWESMIEEGTLDEK